MNWKIRFEPENNKFDSESLEFSSWTLKSLRMHEKNMFKFNFDSIFLYFWINHLFPFFTLIYISIFEYFFSPVDFYLFISDSDLIFTDSKLFFRFQISFFQIQIFFLQIQLENFQVHFWTTSSLGAGPQLRGVWNHESQNSPLPQTRVAMFTKSELSGLFYP